MPPGNLEEQAVPNLRHRAFSLGAEESGSPRGGRVGRFLPHLGFSLIASPSGEPSVARPPAHRTSAVGFTGLVSPRAPDYPRCTLGYGSRGARPNPKCPCGLHSRGAREASLRRYACGGQARTSRPLQGLVVLALGAAWHTSLTRG
jgi:hypothetical protein